MTGGSGSLLWQTGKIGVHSFVSRSIERTWWGIGSITDGKGEANAAKKGSESKFPSSGGHESSELSDESPSSIECNIPATS